MKTGKDDRVVLRAQGSGRWFPGTRDALARLADSCVDGAEVPPLPAGGLRALIAPHAGYVYSGKVAGHAYRVLRDAVAAGLAVDTVVVLGFSHREAFTGVALMDGDAIETPLGVTELDRDAVAQMAASSDRMYPDSRPHMGEHSAENQIPFVQRVAPKARLVVALIGDHQEGTLEALVNALDALSRSRRIVVVASTDLLHDADHARVAGVDQKTLEKVVRMNTEGLAASWSPSNQVCCGIACVLTAMRYAQAQGATKGVLLKYRNSGDDFPESRGNWVVGYGAVAFFDESR